MPEFLEIKLKVKVENPDGADFVVHKLSQGQRVKAPHLMGNGWDVEVFNIERLDGQPFGIEAEFAEYWAETHCEGDNEESSAKNEARGAFLYGVTFGKASAE